MLSELVTKLQALAVEAATPKFIHHPQSPREAVLVANGQCTGVQLPPPLRAHRVDDVASFIDIVLDPVVCPKPEVFHSADELVVLCDRLDRRERVTLTLERTTRWDRLSSIAISSATGSPASFDQKGVLRFLRHEIAVTGIDFVISALRKLDFTRKSTGQASTEHGKESFGRAVEMAVQNAENIPETFKIVVAPYSTPGAQQNVEVQMSLEIDLEQQRVILRVIPDEIERAEAAIQMQVRNALITALCADPDKPVPIFAGTVA